MLAEFVAENRLAELELGIADEAAPVVMLGRAFRIEQPLGDRRTRIWSGSTFRWRTASGCRASPGFLATPPKPAEAP